MSAAPTVLSMLACDHIWRDPSTGKWDLLGVFEWLHSDVTPLRDVSLEVYAQLTGLHGSYEFQLAVVRAEDEKEIARYTLGARVKAHDPLRRLQLGFCVTRLTLPEYGKYFLRLLHDGKAVHDLALWALPEGDEPGPTSLLEPTVEDRKQRGAAYLALARRHSGEPEQEDTSAAADAIAAILHALPKGKRLGVLTLAETHVKEEGGAR